MIRHCVFFSFKTSASSREIEGLVAEFRGLTESIALILDFEWGLNCSPEGLDRGHSHCFSLLFAGERERDAYLIHPAHQAFGLRAGPLLREALVFDYPIQGGRAGS